MQKIENRYEIALDKSRESLEDCQKKREHKSCLECKEIFECALRKTYVNAVYESMAQGQGGGFEF